MANSMSSGTSRRRSEETKQKAWVKMKGALIRWKGKRRKGARRKGGEEKERGRGQEMVKGRINIMRIK